jgi:hypothetical protein
LLYSSNFAVWKEERVGVIDRIPRDLVRFSGAEGDEEELLTRCEDPLHVWREGIG